MKFLRQFFSVFRKRQLEADMAEEMRHHLDLQAERNAAAGMGPSDASHAAQRQFGNVASVQERAREVQGWPSAEQLFRDVRFALRQLMKAPLFAGVAVLSLALGMGACTAIFSVANAVLLRALPVPNPAELRAIHWTGVDAMMRSFDGDSNDVGNRMTADAVSPSLFLALREKTSDLANLFAFARLNDVAAYVRAEAFTANGMLVSDNFFSGLEASPLLGRLFVPGETETLQVVITAEWWTSHFARDSGVIGQTISLNGNPCTIIGVLPPGFPGIRTGDVRDFYVPLIAGSRFLQADLNRSDFWWLRLMARLKPGVADTQLKAALDVVFPREASVLMKSPEMLVRPGRAGADFERDRHARPLWLLLGVVGLVLLVACANLAGLLLARGEARRHEFSVRAALGASRLRLIRQALTESLVIAALGSIAGLFVARVARDTLAVLLAHSVSGGLRYDFSFDFAVLLFAMLAMFVTAVLSGLLPALRAGQVDAIDGLRARGATGAARSWLSRLLVALQVGLSLLLLSGAGLFLRTLVNLQCIDAGFDPHQLVVFRLGTEAAGLNPAERTAFHGRAQETLAALPGVRGAALTMHALLDNESWSGSFSFPGRAPSATEPRASRLVVGETFFATMGIPILQGRGLSAADVDGAPRVMVVNDAFVRKYLSGENPVGQVVNVLRADWRIVGVCGDVRHRNIKDAVGPVAYLSFRQFAFPRMSVVLRTDLEPGVALSLARQAIAGLNPAVPIGHFSTQEQLRVDNIGQERLFALLCGGLAGLALVLACIGIHGLLSFDVTRRTSEIGVRMALGARPADVARPIIREAVLLTGLGILAAVPVLLAGAGLVKNQLYGVPPHDAVTVGGVALLLMAVAVLAAWLPARRAAKVDPVVALRTE